jgi:hypothetical protein
VDIISRKLANDMIYAYHNGRFWRWDDTQSVWKESHLMAQKFGLAKAASATLTPEVFLTDGAQFIPLDDYEIDIAMMDALKDAKPCKTAPIEPVEEEASPVSAVASPAEVAEPFGNTPAAPTFDFSALGDLSDQATEADQQFDLHYGAAQDEYLISCIYLAKIHALTAKAGRYGGGTWTKWYESKGLSEGSARTMVKNGDAFKSATVAELKQLPELTRKDLNLIARSGCAEQLTEAAGDSQRVQELLAQIKTEQARADSAFAEIGDREKTIQSLLNRSEEADARADEAESRYKAALADVTGLQKQYSQMSQRANDAEEARIAARLQCQKAECERDKAEQRAKDAEAALKKQPITAVVDEEEVDKRAHQQAYAIAADMTSELREQLEAAQSAPPVDPQEDIETATSCIVNITGIWSMATPTFTRLVGIGEEFDQLADALLQTCDRIKKDVIAMIAENDGGLKDE